MMKVRFKKNFEAKIGILRKAQGFLFRNERTILIIHICHTIPNTEHVANFEKVH